MSESMSTRVLVFPAGSEIGLEIHRSLAPIRGVELVGASSVDDHGVFAYGEHVAGVPFVDAPGFVDAVERLVAERRIDLILPAHDAVVLALAEARAAGRLGVPVVTSPVETCRLARSKRATYRALAGVIPVPRMWDGIDDVPSYPIFVKPDVGQGSKGALAAPDRAAAERALDADPSLLLLELLPGREYTVDCLTDRHGLLRYAGARSRSRTSNGISVSSTSVDDPVLTGLINELAEKLNAAVAFRGAWFFQVKEAADGTLTLLEIAPRIAGTMALSRARGVNLPLLALWDARDVDVDVLEGEWTARIDRALGARFVLGLDYRHLYLDLDDVLLHGDSLDPRARPHVDPQAAALIFQCRNRGIAVHLVTRHDGDLDRTLRATRLDGLFDQVHHLRAGEPKSSVITEPDAVFVDDSHRERAEVHAVRRIPVFDAASIEVLLHARER